LLALGQASPVVATEPPTPEQYYETAIEAMRDLPQPNFATYGVQLHITGSSFVLTREPNGEAEIGLTMSARGAKPDVTFSAAYRKSDDLTSVETPQGWAITRSPLFNPTWNGVYDWIQYGINGRPGSAVAPPSPTPTSSGLPLIAAVRTMGVAFYDVSGAGTTTCANGDPAYRVHLIARKDPLDHPLTDAAIDERSNRLCFVRLEMRQSVIAAGYTSAIELNIADVNGQALVRTGTVELTARAFGIGVKHVAMTFSYEDVAFPANLTNDIFPGST
jgi:hypothetical protein